MALCLAFQALFDTLPCKDGQSLLALDAEKEQAGYSQAKLSHSVFSLKE